MRFISAGLARTVLIWSRASEKSANMSSVVLFGKLPSPSGNGIMPINAARCLREEHQGTPSRSLQERPACRF